MMIILHLTSTITCNSVENLKQTDPKLFFYVLCKQLQLHFSVLSFKKKSSLNHLRTKYHVKSNKTSINRTSSITELTTTLRTTTREGSSCLAEGGCLQSKNTTKKSLNTVMLRRDYKHNDKNFWN